MSRCSTRPDGSGPSTDPPVVMACDSPASSVWEDVYLDLHSTVLDILKKERPYGPELVALLQRRANSKLLPDVPPIVDAFTDQVSVEVMLGTDRQKLFWPGEMAQLISIINRLLKDLQLEANP